jgi:hypothetical protein
MKITLVNPPRSRYDRSEIAPPLGLLRLAGEVDRDATEVSIVDFNLLYHTRPELAGDKFYEHAVALLLDEKADIYGFTSMAVDSHVALQLAELLKRTRPDILTILGGPHFSSIAEQVLENYPWINFVMKGEGETGFRNFVKNRRESNNPNTQEVLAAQPAPRELPVPPYELVDLDAYFNVNSRRCLNFEEGRGCRFKCAFCYSPVHYRGVRNFSIDASIEELDRLTRLGAKHAFIVEDNFINDPTHALTFCKELENARLGLTWNCYVTLPQLSVEVINAMARAGCTSVFAGVDAVGELSQKAYHKRFLRHGSELRAKIVECVRAGIKPNCAFLLSPPSHPCGADTEDTLRIALMARNSGAHVSLNTLTLYNQTKVQTNAALGIAADDTKARLMLDIPEVVEKNEYARTNPHLFPFHSRYVPGPEWHSFLSGTHCLFTLFLCYPQTLEALWLEKGISPLEIASEVTSAVGDLSLIEKSLRRDAELAVIISVIEKSTTAGKTQTLLEVESLALLNE